MVAKPLTLRPLVPGPGKPIRYARDFDEALEIAREGYTLDHHSGPIAPPPTLEERRAELAVPRSAIPVLLSAIVRMEAQLVADEEAIRLEEAAQWRTCRAPRRRAGRGRRR